MPKKLTYEYVKNYIESFKGYKLLSEEYKNNRTKLKIQCAKGHIFYKPFSKFSSGEKCPKCSWTNYGENKKLTYDYVNSIFNNRGYKLLSTEYNRNDEKLKIQCPMGHIYYSTYGKFQQGRGCPECKKKKSGSSQRLSYPQVKKYIEKQGYKLLSTEYKNASTKLKMVCPKGHVCWIALNPFKSGNRCSECAGNKKRTNQEIIELINFCENIRENENEELEVTCTYCGEWFVPERGCLVARVQHIVGDTNQEHRLYCSQNCKDNCPIFHRSFYPRGYSPATSREVQPELRQLVFERDNYKCQRCSWHKDDLDVGLHCHHIYPLNEDPIQSADVDTCITYCEDCHKWVHQNIAGCGYGEMRC